jgi:tRNA(fMet)-specific endonuclease VapC
MHPSLLDTDILSYYLSGYDDVIERADKYLQEFPTFNLSLITCFEVLSGLEYKQAHRQIQQVERFFLGCNIYPVSEISIRHSAKASGELRRKGITIGNSDLLIAGIAIEHDLTLVTNNEKHFGQIPGLKIDNWKGQMKG